MIKSEKGRWCLGYTALVYYLSIIAGTAFYWWHKGRTSAYQEIAMASGVGTEELMDEVARFQEKN